MNSTTHKTINAQTAGPLFVGMGERIQTLPAPANGRILADLTHSDQRDLHAEARLFATSYTTFDKAARELGIDAAELAEKIDLAALIRAAKQIRDHAKSPLADSCRWDKVAALIEAANLPELPPI